MQFYTIIHCDTNRRAHLPNYKEWILSVSKKSLQIEKLLRQFNKELIQFDEKR